ncbi:hypothetical protein K502DRAFT_347521 [Neoconidiobolus thromboides FSU 785]|nr:hypothetical protein K502DRAFT_347521 [Neoconidiobolus thromboides FSU 785]
MSINFDQLPDIVLEAIFKFANPDELFNYLLLNKYINKIIKYVIRKKLINSVYLKSRKYSNHQIKFIKENPLLIKHMEIDNSNIEYLNCCPNVVSMEYKNPLGDINDSSSVDNSIKISTNFPNLKILKIFSFVSTRLPDIFDNYLDQVEELIIGGKNIILKNIIKYHTLKKLKVLVIYSKDELRLDGLDMVKTKFSKLKKLYLGTSGVFVNPVRFNPNINFSSNLELVIRGEFKEFDISCLGNLKKLKSIKLIDYSGKIFEINENSNNMSFIEGSNIVSLGFLGSKYQIDDSFMKLLTLKEVFIKEFSVEILQVISLLPNIEKMDITEFEQGVMDTIYFEDDEFQCKFIKQITMSRFDDTLEDFACFLSLFPNLEVIKIYSFFPIYIGNPISDILVMPLYNLSNIMAPIVNTIKPLLNRLTLLSSLYNIVNIFSQESDILLYEPKAPLLLIAPIVNSKVYNEIKKNPMIDIYLKD